MRQASITMSWLADRNATRAAAAMAPAGAATGLDSASATAARANSGWIVASQPRRRPSARNGPGGATWSSIGAQRNFSE